MAQDAQRRNQKKGIGKGRIINIEDRADKKGIACAVHGAYPTWRGEEGRREGGTWYERNDGGCQKAKDLLGSRFLGDRIRQGTC